MNIFRFSALDQMGIVYDTDTAPTNADLISLMEAKGITPTEVPEGQTIIRLPHHDRYQKFASYVVTRETDNSGIKVEKFNTKQAKRFVIAGSEVDKRLELTNSVLLPENRPSLVIAESYPLSESGLVCLHEFFVVAGQVEYLDPTANITT